jgi:hypothetical protein
MSAPRRWARRAALSLLAGSGLTAAGLGGGPGAALGAEQATSTNASTETPSPPVTETTPQPSGSEAGTQGTGSAAGAETPSTTTTSAPPASTTPSAPAPAATTPTTTAPNASAPGTGSEAQGAEKGPTPAPTVVVQRKQRTTRGKRRGSTTGGVDATTTPGGEATGAAKQNGPASVPPGTPNGVARAPQAVGGEAGTLAALGPAVGSAVSAQALAFYRVPLFLLPIYQAAALQYDVPWQILAAINEVETDFGSDLSVSTAGAVGWMQFMPATWLQYGVDATNAGYADPYNPVDAVFAAARYLHAAGAAHDLQRAILAYNHSQAYVESVLLRARLIATYPSGVIGTLTGLVDGRLPTLGAHVAPGTLAALTTPVAGTEGTPGTTPGTAAGTTAPGAATSTPGASATAGAVPASPLVAGAQGLSGTTAQEARGTRATRAQGPRAAAVPGSTPPPPPWVVAARAEAAADAAAKPAQLTELLGTPGAPVVAVEGGRVVHLGSSHALGRYLVLRDIYGDIFTYAGLGSVAPRYRRPRPPSDAAQRTPGSATNAGSSGAGAAGGPAGASDPSPTLPASAGHQLPVTLKVKAHGAHHSAATPEPEPEPEAPQGAGKVRLYAHPQNPLARAARARAAKTAGNGRWLPLRTGSLVAQGTVLGQLAASPAPNAGQLRFAVRPAGDSATIDPRALLTNWRELAAALHPRGSKGRVELLGATAQEVFAMSKGELQRAVLADPGVGLDACARRDVSEGAIDRRVLAALEFLSRSGLQPTVGALSCVRGRTTPTGPVFERFSGGSVDIVAINGTPIAGHQGPGTITDVTIRALLTLRGGLRPQRIASLMEYPHAPSTLARAGDWNRIRIGFGSLAHAQSARAARSHKPAAALALGGGLSSAQWDQLVARIAALPQPTVASKPSASAIRDPQAAPGNRALGG